LSVEPGAKAHRAQGLREKPKEKEKPEIELVREMEMGPSRSRSFNDESAPSRLYIVS